MSRVIVKVVGAKKAANNLHRAARNMISFNDAFEDIGDSFRLMVAEQFTGGGWKPLSPITIALRGGTSTPLVRTGRLMDSYVDESAFGNITKTTALHAKFGSSYHGISNIGKVVPVAAWHQSGTSKMPARPVKLVNQYLEERIVEEFANHIFGGWI